MDGFENFKHFSSLTGVGVQMIALDGTPVYETEPYIYFKETLSWLGSLIPDLETQTRASVISGAMQSFRFGGRFFFYSPIGLFHFASPVITEGRHSVTAVGGPVLMVSLEEYIPLDLEGKLPQGFDRGELEKRLATIPVVSPDMANTLSEQLLVNAKHLSDPGYPGVGGMENRYNEYLLSYFSDIPSYEAVLRLADEYRRENAEKKHERIIRAINEYIERNYSKNITLKEAAKSVYLSPSYLSRLINERTGHSFRHLVNMARIAEAVRLLENTDMNLSEVAYQTGFADHSYFTKVFRRHTGSNPSDRRK